MKTIGLTVLKCACFGNVRSMKEYYEKMDLGVDKEYKIVLKLAVPAMLAQLINVLYSIVDRLYISNMQTGGELALAGIGIVAPICTLITSFSYLIGLGGAPFMSISLGEKNQKKPMRSWPMLFWLCLFSVFLFRSLFSVVTVRY